MLIAKGNLDLGQDGICLDVDAYWHAQVLVTQPGCPSHVYKHVGPLEQIRKPRGSGAEDLSRRAKAVGPPIRHPAPIHNSSEILEGIATIVGDNVLVRVVG